jgi:hypothetical protein
MNRAVAKYSEVMNDNRVAKYSEDQARDDHGRFASGGGEAPKGDVDAFEKELDVKELKLSPNTSWMYVDTPKGQAGLDIHDLHNSNKPGVEIHWLTAQERGSGRAAMERVTELADKHGIYVSLWARPLPGQGANEGFTPKKAQLENFYRGFGFEVDRRDNGKYAYMIRAPKTNNKVQKYSEDQARDDHGRFASEDETPTGFYPGEEGHGAKGAVKLSSLGILPEGWITKDGEFIINRDNGGFHARSALQNGLLNEAQAKRVAVNAGETSNIVGYAIDAGNIRVTSENGIAGMQGAKDDSSTLEHMRDGIAHVTSKHIIIELWPKTNVATNIAARSAQEGVIRGSFSGETASEDADKWLASGATRSVVKLTKQRPLEDRLEFQGMKISIENGKGSTRSGVGKDGKPWSITMTYPYGYIRGTEGVDGDHVDCFIGPSKDAAFAYVIHTKEPSTGDYDEDKVMLGWDSAAEAKKAFLDNYTSPDFYQSMDVLPMDEFKEKAFATADEPAMIKDATTSGISTQTGLNAYNFEVDGDRRKNKRRKDRSLQKDLSPLELINQEVADYAEFKPATFDFHPHMTIAYLKPDCDSMKLVGNQILSGQKVLIDSLTITKADGTSEVIKLGTAVKKLFDTAYTVPERVKLFNTACKVPARVKIFLNDEKTLEYCKRKFENGGIFKGDPFIPPPPINKYSDDQPRDYHGRFSSEGGEGGGETKQIVSMTPQERESRLASSKVSDVHDLGGGVSDTRVLTYDDGSKAVFKPGAGEAPGMRRNITNGFQTEREAGAWQVAKIVGMDDIVTPVAITTVLGQRGAVLEWQNGDVAANVDGHRMFDGEEDLGRAAAFDYIIGNEDRHSGNWIVSDDGKLHLIDHGLSFPDKSAYLTSNDEFITAAHDTLDKMPHEFSEPYVENSDKINKALTNLGLPQGAIDGVNRRIMELANYNNWTQLKNDSSSDYAQQWLAGESDRTKHGQFS